MSPDMQEYIHEGELGPYGDMQSSIEGAPIDQKIAGENFTTVKKNRQYSKLRKIQSAMPSRDRSRLEKDRYRDEKERTQMKTMDSTNENAKSQAVSMSKSYISHLENALNEEQRAREKL